MNEEQWKGGGREGGRRTNVVDKKRDDPLFKHDTFLVLDESEEGLCPPAFVESEDEASFCGGGEKEGGREERRGGPVS